MLRLFVIRHGETTANLAGRWQGHGDSPLSPAGEAQADALGARFADHPFDAVYSSDLIRARHTADQLRGPRHIDAVFRELHVGRWEGHTFHEVKAQWPGDLARITDEPTIPIGGGETWQQVEARAAQGLTAIRAAHPEGRVALVAHGGFILSVMEHLLGLAWRWPRPLGRVRNTAVAELHLDATGVRLARYNDVAHVAEPEAISVKAPGAETIERVVHADLAAAALGAPPSRLGPLATDRAGQIMRHPRGDALLCWNIDVP